MFILRRGALTADELGWGLARAQPLMGVQNPADPSVCRMQMSAHDEGLAERGAHSASVSRSSVVTMLMALESLPAQNCCCHQLPRAQLVMQSVCILLSAVHTDNRTLLPAHSRHPARVPYAAPLTHSCLNMPLTRMQCSNLEMSARCVLWPWSSRRGCPHLCPMPTALALACPRIISRISALLVGRPTLTAMSHS